MKTTMAILVLLVSVTIISAWAAVAQPTPAVASIPSKKYQEPGDYLDTIEVNGTTRTFTIHIPPGYKPWTPMPLVINIHGRTGTAFQQEAMSQMNVKADEKGFVAVHPQAMDNPPTWWGPIPNEIGQPDMDFFQELLVYLQQEINIDPTRIYATGFSNGATMANRLGCDMSHTFAAIAPVSGGHVAFDLCEGDRPIPVLAFHGTEDTIIPYHGNNRDTPPVHAWVGAWAERNGCDLTASVSHPHPTITRETWNNCDGSAIVILYSIEGAGHTWPGSDFGAHLGGVTLDIDATDVIWEFFESHPLP